MTFARSGIGTHAAGRAVCRRATLILTQLEALEQEVAAARGQDRGSLRVGAIPSANALLPRILRTFGEAHPHVRLTVIEGSDGEVLDWLQTGAADIGTLTAGAVSASVPDLVMRPLATDQMLAALPSGHDLAVPIATSSSTGNDRHRRSVTLKGDHL